MFHYFGYGSNLNLTSLRAKGVQPRTSELAILHGWKLAFNVRHWFRHEGGVGNIIPCNNPRSQVHGLLHACHDEQLASLDAMESYGTGYDRIEVELDTARGPVRALTYVGLPDYIDDRCLPTRRYLNILLSGAVQAGLDAAYIDQLRQQPLHQEPDYPPFEYPAQPEQVFDQQSLSRYPNYTALAGAVFDMTDARSDLQCLQPLFGGRDTTLFHLRRLDSSDGQETLEDIRAGRISAAGRRYINAYLHEYQREYRYAGRYQF